MPPSEARHEAVQPFESVPTLDLVVLALFVPENSVGERGEALVGVDLLA